MAIVLIFSYSMIFSTSSSLGSSPSIGRSILDLMKMRSDAISMKSSAVRRFISLARSTYSRNCSVIKPMGMSKMSILFRLMSVIRTGSGPSKNSI